MSLPRNAAGPLTLLAVIALAPLRVAHGAELAEAERQAFNAAVASVANTVVQIHTVGGLEEVDNQLLAQGPTTGLIVTDDGYIVSSAFNFAQQPTSILVRLPDGKQRPAKIVGRDANRMLVLLRVDADQSLPVPTPAPISDLRVGDWAIALGRTYETERVDESVGIVSATNRMFGRVVQTDANVSPANYGGPLVDIRGRVIGVLVPMSPDPGGSRETSDVAGAEYYDSGVGFAVPLEQVLAILPRWIEQKNLKRGLLGISMQAGPPHATPPTLSAVWPKSPAAEAGWKAGDSIVEVEGQAVESQTQLRFQVVPRYAGDAIRVKLRRGEGDEAKDIESTIKLAAELEPFRHAFLGVLPTRTALAKSQEAAEKPASYASPAEQKPSDEKPGNATQGISVRTIWPESPADRAGLRAGDRLLKLDDESVDTVEKVISLLNAKNPGDKVTIGATRGEEKIEQTVELGELPTDVLSAANLPPTAPDEATEEAAAAPPKIEEFKLPELPQSAWFYAPPAEGPAPGFLLWLGDGKRETCDALAAAWQKACRRDRLVLLMPAPGDKSGWSGDDMEYLGRLLQAAMKRFSPDPRRIVVAGEGKAGQLAYALAFRGRRVIRGAATVDSPLPRTLELPPTSPNERLAILSVETQNAPLSLLIRQDRAKLQKAGYPATQVVRHGEDARAKELEITTRASIARWIDGLDRF